MTLLQMNAYSNNSPEILYKNIVINFSPIWWGNKGLTICFLDMGKTLNTSQAFSANFEKHEHFLTQIKKNIDIEGLSTFSNEFSHKVKCLFKPYIMNDCLQHRTKLSVTSYQLRKNIISIVYSDHNTVFQPKK